MAYPGIHFMGSIMVANGNGIFHSILLAEINGEKSIHFSKDNIYQLSKRDWQRIERGDQVEIYHRGRRMKIKKEEAKNE